MRTVAAFVLATLALVAVPGAAEATRPVPGFTYPDVCRNIDGKQTILEVVGASARYEFAQKKNGEYFKRRCRVATWRQK